MTGMRPPASTRSAASGVVPCRKLTRVPACDVVRGDCMRDRGAMLQVMGVQASASDAYVELVLEPVAGRGSRLVVPPYQDVSVWRLCGER